MDLPFAQKRWYGVKVVENVTVLSDHQEANFGKSFGVLVKELKLLGRAVFVVDKDGVVRYREIVDALTNEPDYESALKAEKESLC